MKQTVESLRAAIHAENLKAQAAKQKEAQKRWKVRQAWLKARSQRLAKLQAKINLLCAERDKLMAADMAPIRMANETIGPGRAVGPVHTRKRRHK